MRHLGHQERKRTEEGKWPLVPRAAGTSAKTEVEKPAPGAGQGDTTGADEEDCKAAGAQGVSLEGDTLWLRTGRGREEGSAFCKKLCAYVHICAHVCVCS